jgi:hypothetical protein
MPEASGASGSFELPESPAGGTTLTDAEEAARKYHVRHAMPELSLWNDGNNLLLRGMDPFNSHLDSVRPDQRARIVMLIQGWNNLYCALQLATQGHYGPALNLLRLPAENWTACYYLELFPKEHARFLPENMSDPDTPTFNDMQQKIEGKLGEGTDTVTRGWIKALHKSSHVDRISLGFLLVPTRAGFTLGLGPQRRLGGFIQCTFGATASISALLGSINTLRGELGEPRLEQKAAYDQRVLAFQQSRDKPALRAAMLSAPDD